MNIELKNEMRKSVEVLRKIRFNTEMNTLTIDDINDALDCAIITLTALDTDWNK